MNFRLSAVLFGVILVLGVVLLAMSLLDGDSRPASDVLVEELANNAVKPEEVTEVLLERGDGSKLKFVRGAKDQWTIVEPYAARADASAVMGVVNALFRAKPVHYGDLSPNKAVHGLDKPGLKITLAKGDERSSRVDVGEVSVGGSKAIAFVTTSARPDRPMAVARPDIDVLFKSAKESGSAGDLAKWVGDYRSKQVFAVDSRAVGGDDVSAIKLTMPNKGGKELALSRTGADWKFDAPAGWGEASAAGDPAATTPSTITGVRALLNAVVNLQAATGEDFIQDPKDLKEYGLNPDNPDLIRVEVKPKDGPVEVAFLGKKVDAPAAPPAFPGAPPPAGKLYVKLENAPGVIRVGANNTDGVAAIIQDPAPLRDRDLLKDDARTRLDAVDVTTGGQTLKLRKTTGTTEWKLYGGPSDPQAANQAAVTTLIGLLTQNRVIKDFPAANDANFAGPQLKAEVKLWADGIEAPAADAKLDPKAEPKLKGTPTILQIGKKDALGVYVRRILPSGAKADFILPEKVKVGTEMADADVVATLTRTRLDYLNVELKSFALTQANRLTVTPAGGKVTEVVVEKSDKPLPGFPSGKWSYAQPADRKGLVADADLIRGDLLNYLATEKPVRVVAEQPSDADLVKFGLDPKAPRLKVTVGLEATGTPPPPDADKERTYLFGNETDDKQHVYARQDGKPAVFTVGKVLVDKLLTADLRDKTVVRFDPAKATKVKVRGWREKTGGEMLVREFSRPVGGAWAAVMPAGYAVDPAKVDGFLQEVSRLKVKEFLPPGRRPEHRFPPEQDGFEITIELDGAPPVLLNIAATIENGASRVAALGSPPSEALFSISADALKSYRDNLAAFSK